MPEASAAGAVLSRVLGNRSQEFLLTVSSSAEVGDAFEVKAANGRVFVRGTSELAVCRGAYHYLREACQAQVAWSGGAVVLPDALPDFEYHSAKCPFRHRYYLSVCTFGYSTPWWDWARWEREIDWMALHGINMPVALGGQELIWQRVFRQLGVPDNEIAAHFSGPAYLPWHRLGNINGHEGPLPQSWLEDQAVLQKRILDRERDLGMNPVAPGFSGFVPTGFARIRPDVPLQSATPWAGFPPTAFVDPRQPSFQEIGKLFLSEYRQEFGPVHHYLCETFAEQNPQFAKETELEDLRALGRATWQTLEASDPDAVWVMQGWPFYYARDYWSHERTAALFEDAPDDRLIVLDLATEELEVWREQPAVRRKGWIFDVVHNYGQTTHLHGDLQGFADRAWKASSDPDHGNLLGMGIAPEGIDQNAVVYELLTDVMWRDSHVDVKDWTHGYARSRYGGGPDSVHEAWALLLDSVYGPAMDPTLDYCWRFRPGDQPLVSRPDVAKVGRAATLLLSAAPELGSNELYRRDLVDVAKTWLTGLADSFLNVALSARLDGGEGYPRAKACFFEILTDLDELMATRVEHRLTSWIARARMKGASLAEADLFERNARSLVTWWGGPYLFDYATREWAGLIMDFHSRRWRLYFEAMDRGDAVPDFGDWERRWSESKVAPVESAPGDALMVVRRLVEKYPLFDLPPSSEPPGDVLRFGPMRASGDTEGAGTPRAITVDLGTSRPIVGLAVFPMFGQGCRATYEVAWSQDGVDWTLAPRDDCQRRPTYRGVRHVFPSTSMRYARARVVQESGDGGQLFQLFAFASGALG